MPMGYDPIARRCVFVEPEYQVRFINPEHAGELVNNYHTARTALSDKPVEEQSRYHRKLLACRWFNQRHPEVSEAAAYKDLCGLLGH